MNHEHQPPTRHWARRTDFGEETNRLASAVAHARGQGRPLIDLTVTNPTRCGFDYDTPALLAALAVPESLLYQADPLGSMAARRAISTQYYGARGIAVAPDHLVLSASTSEAYGFLMRLLCEAGDELLVPEPSYPLFDLLARLHDVRLVPYPLRLHDGWRVDWPALRSRISPRTRAVVIVHPNNPTGHAMDSEERLAFQALAGELHLSLIVDEVFLDFPVELLKPPQSFAGGAPVLTFVLSGLSKVLALPQMKLAWTAVCGPAHEVAEAMHRLGFIADTFLSVNGPVQCALERWLSLAAPMQQQIVHRTRANAAVLDRLLTGSVCSRLPVPAGWSALLRVPAVLPDEEFASHVVQEADVVTHPGSFYGLPAAGWLVLSLLVREADFLAGVTRLLRTVERLVTGEHT